MFNSTLLGVAAEHGLHALTDWEDPELDDCFDEVCHPCISSFHVLKRQSSGWYGP